MTTIALGGFVRDNAGGALTDPTVELFDRNDTATVLDTASLSSTGYWSFDRSPDNDNTDRYDVRITNGSEQRFLSYDDKVQLTSLETAYFRFRNPTGAHANKYVYDIVGSAITADRTLTLPLITGTDTLAVLGLAQTFSAATTFSATITGPSGTWDSGGMDIAASASYAVAGTDILSDSSGTMTLSNIDALDATTEAAIETAIDTLSNLTSVGTITTGVWQGTDVGVAYGGTGVSDFTANGVLIGNGSSAVAVTATMATKGHLMVGDGSGVPSMLAVGTDTHILTADSGEGTGVKWAAPAAAAAGSLTGSTLASGVTASSLTSVGTLTSLAISGDIISAEASAGLFAIYTSRVDVDLHLGVGATSGSDVGIYMYGEDVGSAATRGSINYRAYDKGSADDASHRFYITTTEKMRLNEDGELLLGDSPSALAHDTNHEAVIQLGSQSSLWASSTGAVTLAENAYHNGTNWVHSTTDETARMSLQNGRFILQQVQSGSGNITTFDLILATNNLNQANGGGNVSIGEDATANDKLAVAGTLVGTSTATGIRVDTDITPDDGADAYGIQANPTLTKGSGSTHNVYASILANPPTIAAGGSATVTRAVAMYAGGAVSGGTNNYSVLIHQGAGDHPVIAAMSSDVTHGLTSIAETNVFWSVEKSHAGDGGTRFFSIAEDFTPGAGEGAHRFQFYGGSANTTKTTTSGSLIELQGYEHDGANSLANLTANSNLFGLKGRVSGANKTLFLVDEDGDFWSVTTGQTFDTEDDAMMALGLEKVRSGERIRNSWAQHCAYNESALIEADILGAPLSEGGLTNVTQTQRMHNGAIGQLMEDYMDVVQVLMDVAPEHRSRLNPRIQNRLALAGV